MTPHTIMQPFEQSFTIPSSTHSLYNTTSPSSAHTDANPYLINNFHPYPQTDFRPTFYNPFEIKHRRRTSRAQLKVLEKSFSENAKPNATIRRILAQKLDMTPRGVQIWFQNRRAKAKLQRRKSNNKHEEETGKMISDVHHQAQQDCMNSGAGGEINQSSVLFSQFFANTQPLQEEKRHDFISSLSSCDHANDGFKLPNHTYPNKSSPPLETNSHCWEQQMFMHQVNENARAVAAAAAASCYMGPLKAASDHHQDHQDHHHQPAFFNMDNHWLAMPIDSLGNPSTAESAAMFDEWRRKSCPELSTQQQHSDYLSQSSSGKTCSSTFASQHSLKERRLSEPVMTATGHIFIGESEGRLQCNNSNHNMRSNSHHNDHGSSAPGSYRAVSLSSTALCSPLPDHHTSQATPLDFYYPIQASQFQCSPDSQPQLTPLLSNGFGSPVSLDGYCERTASDCLNLMSPSDTLLTTNVV